MKTKIVMLPLDERPCNMYFPERLFSQGDIEISRPKKLGDKKKPADIEEIHKFIKKECKDADALILSMDTLLYGGLIPSRLHHEKQETLLARMEILKEIRKENPALRIYAFQVIMRCPDYSSSDEEPDYYERYGKEIHEAGVAVHKSRICRDEEHKIARLLEKIDADCLNDYISRREKNRYMNVETLQYLRDGIIDELVIPQDDSSKYGYAAMDQASIRQKIAEYDMMEKVLMYPGADEVELTLLARFFNKMHEKKPKVYVKYASEASRDLIPLYEGCTLAGTIKYHVLSAGCQLTESYEQADFILAVTAPAAHMEEAINQPSLQPEYLVERNLEELIDFIKERIREGKIVTVADNAYANGGDLSFIHLLDKNNLLMELGGYAGWNTSANTMGTAIAEAVNLLYTKRNKQHDSFLLQRYLEDGGYCAKVRKSVTEQLKPLGMDYFDVKEEKGKVSCMIAQELEAFGKIYLASIASGITIKSVAMPWRRMFEVDLEVEYDREWKKKTGGRNENG